MAGKKDKGGAAMAPGSHQKDLKKRDQCLTNNSAVPAQAHRQEEHRGG